MALTRFQRDVCRLLADTRLRSGESYVAGEAALNELLSAPRLSRDIDLFHDTEAALAASWAADRRSLESCQLSVIRERPTFVEAEVRRGLDSVVIQWAHDSAYRFFPLVQHADHSETELRGLDFEGEAPDAASLARRWRVLLDTGREIVAALPADEAGRAVITSDGVPYRGEPAALREALRRGELWYHEGRIRGAFPRIVR